MEGAVSGVDEVRISAGLAASPRADRRLTLGLLEPDSEVVELLLEVVGAAGGSVVHFESVSAIGAHPGRPRLDGILVRCGASVQPVWEVLATLRDCGVEAPIIVLSEQGAPMATVWPHRSNQRSGVGALSALHDVLGKLLKLQEWRAARRDVRNRLGSLTGREGEVATRIALGRLNKEIADDLGISVRTVESHRSRLMHKVGVRSPVELAWMYLLDRLRWRSG